eukprot:gene7346-biopygen5370
MVLTAPAAALGTPVGVTAARPRFGRSPLPTLRSSGAWSCGFPEVSHVQILFALHPPRPLCDPPFYFCGATPSMDRDADSHPPRLP